MRPLPADFVAAGLALARGASLFGKRLEDMERDELIAAAAMGWDAERRAREEGTQRVRRIIEIIRSARWVG